MKRISTAAVAAATALSLTAVPAMAQETSNTTTAPTTTTTAPSASEAPENDTTAPETDTTAPTTTPNAPATTTPEKPNNTKKQSGSSQGTIVGLFAGTLGAVLTTSLIVFSDPRGANKIIDMVNSQFDLGIPHLHTPKVELPNFQLPF